MKQTAVEWLVEELIKNKFITKNGGFTNPLIEQAKEMEKQQIIDAANLDKRHYDNAEQYYNETFKNK